MSKVKVILHLDADSFFASVEISKNPKLRGLPVVTGEERGIATSMSPEAKKLGVTRGMPGFQIKREFPEVIIVHSDYETYAMYSKRMFQIVRRYTPSVEEYSIDECFADITIADKANKMPHEEILRRIQRDIDIELNISVSIGAGPTKSLAKLASKKNKPHGIALINENTAHEFLREVPIGKVWGIGRSGQALLSRKGIKTAFELATIPEEKLKKFAHKPLIEIWHELNCRPIYDIPGDDDSEKPQSISRTLSFPLKTDRRELFSELARNVENACIKARMEGVISRSVRWFLKTKEFRYTSREFSLREPTHAPNIILEKIWLEFQNLDIKGKKYRTTGVTLFNFCNEGEAQSDLFGASEKMKKNEEIFHLIDALSDKYGRHAIKLAAGLNAHREDEEGYEAAHSQMSFFNKIKKTGKELSIPYLGEVT